jgi:hypothetical protein
MPEEDLAPSAPGQAVVVECSSCAAQHELAAFVAAAGPQREAAPSAKPQRQAQLISGAKTRNHAVYGRRFVEIKALSTVGTGVMVLGALLFVVGLFMIPFGARPSIGDLTFVSWRSLIPSSVLFMIGGLEMRAVASIWGASLRAARKINPVDDPDLWE